MFVFYPIVFICFLISLVIYLKGFYMDRKLIRLTGDESARILFEHLNEGWKVEYNFALPNSVLIILIKESL